MSTFRHISDGGAVLLHLPLEKSMAQISVSASSPDSVSSSHVRGLEVTSMTAATSCTFLDRISRELRDSIYKLVFIDESPITLFPTAGVPTRDCTRLGALTSGLILANRQTSAEYLATATRATASPTIFSGLTLTIPVHSLDFTALLHFVTSLSDDERKAIITRQRLRIALVLLGTCHVPRALLQSSIESVRDAVIRAQTAASPASRGGDVDRADVALQAWVEWLGTNALEVEYLVDWLTLPAGRTAFQRVLMVPVAGDEERNKIRMAFRESKFEAELLESDDGDC